MGYEWDAPLGPLFSFNENEVDISATKSGGGESLTLVFRLVDVGFEGPDFPSDQEFADVLGVIAGALSGDGFTVQVSQPGSGSRALAETP